MKHEMTAREYLRAMKRITDKCLHIYTPCKDCRFYRVCLCNGTEEEIKNAVSTLEEWLAENPEETLEPLGDNIYFDPKHRIVPDEMIRITTIEMTQVVPKEFIEAIGNHEITQDEIEEYKDGLRELFMLRHGPDDLHIKVQQFVTKCHEEEV